MYADITATIFTSSDFGLTWKKPDSLPCLTSEQVVQDGNLITSRRPEDIPAFSNQIIETLAKVPLAKAS